PGPRRATPRRRPRSSAGSCGTWPTSSSSRSPHRCRRCSGSRRRGRWPDARRCADRRHRRTRRGARRRGRIRRRARRRAPAPTGRPERRPGGTGRRRRRIAALRTRRGGRRQGVRRGRGRGPLRRPRRRPHRPARLRPRRAGGPDRRGPRPPRRRGAARPRPGRGGPRGQPAVRGPHLAVRPGAGGLGLDHELAAGAAPVVSAMLRDPALRRQATLLDGFAAELAASCPGAALERVPVRRWADLWSRALLLTVPGAAGGPATAGATGRLLPLGVDLQEHATAVQAQVHAVLEPADGGPSRRVRASVSVPKPDTVVGAGLWQLLRPHMSLLAAVSEGRAMELDAMPVTAEGDLIWDDARARTGEPADALVSP